MLNYSLHWGYENIQAGGMHSTGMLSRITMLLTEYF